MLKMLRARRCLATSASAAVSSTTTAAAAPVAASTLKVSTKVGPTPSPNSVVFNYKSSLGNIPETKVTRLPNGITVASESNPNFQAATVGIWVKAGSRHDASGRGVANFLEAITLKGNKSLDSRVGSLGAQLNAYTAREHTAYFATAVAGDVPKAVEMLTDAVIGGRSASITEETVEATRRSVIAKIAAAESDKEAVVFDHVHGSAFQSTSLAPPVSGSAGSVKSITKADLEAFAEANYTADRIVLVGSGNVSHESLVKLAESNLGSLKAAATKAAPFKKPTFVGSDVRARFDNLSVARVAFATEAPGVTNPDHWPMLVLHNIVGAWDHNLVSATKVSSKLAAKLNEYHLADNFRSFQAAYSDTGLWGIYLESHNVMTLDDMTHHVLQEFHRLCLNLTEVEVFQAKNKLRTALLASVLGSETIADDIGRQVLAHGKRLTAWEIDGLIEAVNVKDVMRVANKYIYDKEVVVVGYGPVEALQDYTRIRSAMSPILW